MSEISDDVLEQLLSEPAERIEDAGFTEAVLLQLPPRREKRARQTVLLFASVAAGAVPVALALLSPDSIGVVLSGVTAIGVAAVVTWSALTATELV